MESYTHFVVTPWRNSQELVQLRRDLYRLNDDNVDRRKGAVNKVLAWRARHESLPLLLESTADILDVILQDEAGTLNHNATRLLYATSISRFVTGYLDTQIDLTRDRPSWFPPGKSIQPPVSLLEVRHCIVHRHMPSLAELKRAARTALDWLWDWYWSQLEHAFGLPTTSPSSDDPGADGGVAEKLHNILKTYVKARKQEIKAKRRADLCTSAARAWSTYTLRFTSGDTTLPSSATQTALLRLLVNDTQILPQDKGLGSSMSGAFLIWSPFLLLFSLNSPSFFPAHLALASEQINSPDRSEAEKEGLCEWAIHMLGSRDWREARGSKERAIREKVLGECMTELGTWNLRLAEGIVDAMDYGEGEMWQAILDASRTEGGENMVVDRVERAEETKETEEGLEVIEGVEKLAEAVPAEKEGRAKAPESGEAKEKIIGLQKVVGLWKPKPIGWLPDGWEEDA
ncbi:Las1-domain-containing protein [Didymella exigua CBS 183.55]|uniref:Las1-domain-containing protein n=1 Tax=Didymella exigua CBS 183.55 TaxID=1150837 RepID=A0A6A5S026_9PLEO|nr:Las1-domain-containing protein [Didymella exigua CBS 183.55]KAF1933149.1 Las1-domain-containing protein [Didymella exigua CBS 183.55]